jgi:hypothetical protein
MLSKRQTDARIPAFFLYGEPLRTPDAQAVHIETIAARSEPRGWAIQPHRHHALRQLLLVHRGSVEASIDGVEQRLQGKHDAAAALLRRITPDMTVIENDAYLKRLRFYQGQLSAETLLASTGTGEEADLTLATQGYGVANWYLVTGETEKALALLERVAASPHRSAFGTIAAEADLARLRSR